MNSLDRILSHLSGVYTTGESAALNEQLKNNLLKRPLSGVKILDATPVFRNTLNKYLPLLAAGAKLTVGVSKQIPHDPKTVEFLKSAGVDTVNAANESRMDDFDIILDCAGGFHTFRARLGYAELTRSGAAYYQNCAKPVFLVDDSKIKAIETCFGTGDGFLRAMKQSGYTDFNGKKIVLFGGGKVGRGIAFYALRAGAQVFVVDPDPSRVIAGANFIAADLRQEISRAVKDAWCIVTATGVKHALEHTIDAAKLINSPAILVNMGVENEFGREVPSSRVLNQNRPLNFILEEPTLLKYIDPVMALDNEMALLLARDANFAPGLHKPPAEIESRILNFVRNHGLIAAEIDSL